MAGFLEQALKGRVGSFFLVFPDCDAVTPLAQGVRAIAPDHHAHASGRPWLAGRWTDDECVVVSARDMRLAVIGSFPPGGAVAARWHTWCGMGCAERLSGAMAESLPGSFHLVTSAGGEVTVSGTASGVRLVFSAGVGTGGVFSAGGPVTVAASRADVLADLIGAGLDETQVAVRLLSAVPHPLPLASMWRGVRTVEPGSRLHLARDGSARTRVWWTPPVPEEPLSVGAPRVLAALNEAVEARTEAGGTVTCDLSGGMDSTAICFLAAAGPAKVIARTISAPDTAGTDLVWAGRTAKNLREVEHVVMPGDGWPPRFSGLAGYCDLMDEPTTAVLGRAELERFYFPLSSWGGRVHLTGFGGDHATRPVLALGRLRGFRALHRWPGGETFRALADRRRYQKWLIKSAYALHASAHRPEWTVGWSPPPRLPEWVIPAAATAVRKAIIRAAEGDDGGAEPMAPGRAPHVELSAIRQGGRWLRQVEQMCATAGLPIASPFFDDRVVRASLSVRPADRPVLRAALLGIVPDECLERAAKEAFSLPADRALTEHRADLLALWDGSCLGAMGIIDEKRVRASIGSRTMTHLQQDPLDTTVSVELWLRTLKQSHEGNGGGQPWT